MKKYILFFISIGLLLATVLIYNTMSVEEKRKVTFSESGYILNSTTERFYFYEDETYTTSYNDKIIFFDTEGQKITLGNDNFIHYSSGNIVALQESVLLDLNGIEEDPIIYYNISSNKEIKKVNDRYVIKNLNNDIQFEQGIWKISSNKYIILGKDITIQLENGTEKKVQGYIEISYSDNEIVNIYNQELSYQTISSESYIVLNDDIRLNLGTKIVSKDQVNKMSLEDMVINSDDNVTLVDLTIESEEENKEENENENEAQDQTTTQGTIQGGTAGGAQNTTTNNTTNNTTTNSNSQTSGTINGSTTGDSTISDSTEEEKNENIIEIDTPEIKYDEFNDTEVEIDLSQTLAEPEFRLGNLEVSAIGIKGNIKITDENDLLSKDETINIKIINNETGKIVYTDQQEYGSYNIEIGTNSLKANTQYTIIASGTYIVNQVSYTKNFLYKSFKTSEIGITLTQEGFTDSEMNFTVLFSDDLIESLDISIWDANGIEVNKYTGLANSKDGKEKEVDFTNLNSNSEYIVKLTNMKYEGSTKVGDDWTIQYNFKTLKAKAKIDKLNYSVNKKDGKFTLYIDQVTDKDESIQSFTYIMYELKDDNKYTSKDIIYQKETTNKEITIDVGDSENTEGVKRQQYYVFKVIANTYDNEKYVEISSDIAGAFILDGKEFPTVRFDTEEIKATSIKGNLVITDTDNSLLIDNNNNLIIKYRNDIEAEQEYARYSIDSFVRQDEEIIIPISITGLKKHTSYTFSVYGSVDLKDDYNNNGEEDDIYSNVLIGNAIVTTNDYNAVTAEFESVEDTTKVFNVKLTLDGNEYEEESISSITFALQAGSTYREGYDLATRTLTKKDYETDEAFTKALCTDGIDLYPGLFVDYNGKWNESNYMILASVTIDDTKYKNEIPLTGISSDDRGTLNYKNEDDGKLYNAAYIIIEGEKTAAPAPDEDNKKIVVTGITNEQYNDEYGFEKDEKLDNGTIMAYKVSTKYKPASNEKTIKSITYYVWDSDGNALLDENGNQITSGKLTVKNNLFPYYLFGLDYGYDQLANTTRKNGLYRGDAYYFSFTLEYEDGNVWPECLSDDNNTYTNFSENSGLIYPLKQTPEFKVFPANSSSNGITYKYYCYDPDFAMELSDNSKEGIQLYKRITSDMTQAMGIYKIDYDRPEYIGTEFEWNPEDGTLFEDVKIGYGSNINIDSLEPGGEYILFYQRMLNKYDKKYSSESMQTLLTQKFEGINNIEDVAINSLEGDYIKYDTNKIKIQLGTEYSLRKVAAAKVILKYEGGIKTTNLIELIDDSKGYSIEVDITKDIEGANDLIGKTIDVDIELYYDTGRIGFLPESHTNEDETDDSYVTYVKYVNDEERYMTINSGNEFTSIKDGSGIKGSIFDVNKFNCSESKDLVSLNIQKLIGGRCFEGTLNSTSYGLEYDGGIIVQKDLGIYTLSGNKVDIDNIILGVSNIDIKTTLTEATINATLINPMNETIIEMNVEMIEKIDDSYNWEDSTKVIIQDITSEIIDNNTIKDLKLEGLNPASYYAIRFKYKLEGDTEYTYTYDIETRKHPGIHKFETVADIGIKSIKVEYKANNYKDKYLNLSYYVDEEKSNMYYATKYEFFDMNDEKLELINENMCDMGNGNGYTIVDGVLYVNNNQQTKFTKVEEKIKISPNINKFTFGEEYKIKITPVIKYIDNTNTEIIKEIDFTEKQFKLNALKEPAVAIKAIRKDNGNLLINTTISDEDCTMVGETWGRYTLIVEQNGEEIYSENCTLQNASNYQIHISNCEFEEYEYKIKVTYSTDKANKDTQGGNTTTDRTFEKTVLKIQKGIDAGNIDIIANTDNKEYIDIKFSEAYNINKVNEITYNIFENGQPIIAGSIYTDDKPRFEWKSIGSEFDKIDYFTLEEKLTNNQTYLISIKLYSGRDFIASFEKNYTHIISAE